uniref:F-box domain-containing protein n=1 Tax=Moniliophthora roreri TaxID=221103 RepID=A0A0W0FTK9_MONRR
MITYPSTADSIPETNELDEIWRIDQKINSLEEQLRRLRTQRNAKAAISRLPIEIMVHIFTYCVPRRDSVALINTCWLSFTHVCHSWRSIALNYAGLWTCIDFQSNGLAQAMLERSKTAVLDAKIPRFHYHRQDMEWRHLLTTIQHQLSRIGHLHVGPDHTNLNREFVSGLVEPAPSLRSLEVTNFTELDLPSNFLAGTAPLLTQLRLDLTYLPWDSPLLHALTFLELRGDGVTNIPTEKQFVGALQSMPLLEILILKQMFPNSITDTNTIPLPHLRELQLTAESENIDRCNGVIGHLSFPKTTMLKIDYYTESDDAGVFNPLLSHLSRIFSTKESPVESPRTIRALSLVVNEFSEYTTISLNAWNVSGISFEDSDTLPPCILSLQLEWDRPRSNHSSDDLKAVLVSFPLTTIETLGIQGFSEPEDIHDEEDDDRTPANNLVKYLDPLLRSTSVKRLVVCGLDDSGQLYAVLGTVRGSDSPTQPLVPAFPAVHTLVLVDSYLGYPDDPSNRHPLLTHLTDALRTRMKHGQKLEKLILRFCGGVTEELVASLKEVIKELDWDDMESVLDQDDEEGSESSLEPGGGGETSSDLY